VFYCSEESFADVALTTDAAHPTDLRGFLVDLLVGEMPDTVSGFTPLD